MNDAVSRLGGEAQPRDAEGPVFREPWEASAFALVVKLSEAGHFTWSEWVSYLSKELAHDDHGPIDLADDSADDYYAHWLSALEKLVADKALLSEAAIEQRHRYLIDNPVPHEHTARRDPIKIA